MLVMLNWIGKHTHTHKRMWAQIQMFHSKSEGNFFFRLRSTHNAEILSLLYRFPHIASYTHGKHVLFHLYHIPQIRFDSTYIHIDWYDWRWYNYIDRTVNFVYYIFFPSLLSSSDDGSKRWRRTIHKTHIIYIKINMENPPMIIICTFHLHETLALLDCLDSAARFLDLCERTARVEAR